MTTLPKKRTYILINRVEAEEGEVLLGDVTFPDKSGEEAKDGEVHDGKLVFGSAHIDLLRSGLTWAVMTEGDDWSAMSESSPVFSSPKSLLEDAVKWLQDYFKAEEHGEFMGFLYDEENELLVINGIPGVTYWKPDQGAVDG